MTLEERTEQRNERIRRKITNIKKAIESNEEKIHKITFSTIKLQRTLLLLEKEIEQPLVETKPSEEERMIQSNRDRERINSEYREFIHSQVYNK